MGGHGTRPDDKENTSAYRAGITRCRPATIPRKASTMSEQAAPGTPPTARPAAPPTPEGNRHAQRVAALSSLARTLAGARDPQAVARTGLEQAIALTGLDAGELLLWDKTGTTPQRLAHAGSDPQLFAGPAWFPGAQGPVPAAFRQGDLLVAGNAARVPIASVRPELAAAGFQMLLMIPLRIAGSVGGVICLVGRSEHYLPPEDETVLLGLAAQVSAALDHCHIADREAALRRQLDALNSASLAFAAELSLPTLLQRIADTARELTGADYAALGVSDEGGDGLIDFITSGITAEQRRMLGALPRGHGLLGLILRGSAAVRTDNIATHPAAHGFPPGHPRMTSFLGAPIVLRGRNLGNLYLTDKHGGRPFSAEDEALVVQLAAHAAIAIENAHLYGRTSEALEQRVAELNAANAQLSYLSSLALNAQEEERRRLARELHDDTAQSLASLLVRLRVLERSEDPRLLRGRLQEFRDVLTRSLDDVRRMALDLRPASLDDLGLVPALESHTRAVQNRADLRVRFAARGLDERLPAHLELVIYRVVQEALSNIVKHAGARAASVTLERQGQTLLARVQDDGRGFDVPAALASKERGLGLFGMQERAALTGGTVTVESTPGTGTTVSAAFPLPNPG